MRPSDTIPSRTDKERFAIAREKAQSDVEREEVDALYQMLCQSAQDKKI